MEITIKKVLDKEGFLDHIELHQDGQMIKLSLASTDIDSLRTNYKWNNLKQIIDNLQENEKATISSRLKRNAPGAK